MASTFSSTKNTRSILPNSYRFIRSDVPDKLTESEIQWLIDHNITTIIDLREETERHRRKCSLEAHPIFEYLCMPVTGGNMVPESPDNVSKSYIKMADTQMERIIDTIWNAKTNVLYFCNAGKDRTGVVSAILLSRLGMDRNYIVHDYMKSKENLSHMLYAYAQQNPEMDIEVITPHESYIHNFIIWLEKQKQLALD